MKKSIISLTTLTAFASVAMAQTSAGGAVVSVGTGISTNNGLTQFIALLQTIVAQLLPLGIGIAVLALIWFVIQYIFKPDDHAKALKGMGVAILGLFVIVSIWGIIAFAGSILGIGQGGAIPVPRLPVNVQGYNY